MKHLKIDRPLANFRKKTYAYWGFLTSRWQVVVIFEPPCIPAAHIKYSLSFNLALSSSYSGLGQGA